MKFLNCLRKSFGLESSQTSISFILSLMNFTAEELDAEQEFSKREICHKRFTVSSIFLDSVFEVVIVLRLCRKQNF